MDDIMDEEEEEEEIVAHNNHEMSDYDDDVDDPEYNSPSNMNGIPSRYGDYRSALVAVSEPLSLVIDKSAPNTESGSYMRPLVTARPRTPEDDDEDSYFYDRPPRNADSAPPSLASIL